MTPPKRGKKAWAPKTIYLTRDGWNDTCPDDSEVLWSETRVCESDVAYRRITPLPKKG